MGDTAPCIWVTQLNRYRWKITRTKQEYRLYLPKIAEVINSICRFKPDNSSVTGLRASSASLALFSRSFFWTSKAVRSSSKNFFSCSKVFKLSFKSFLALEAAASVSASLLRSSLISSSLRFKSAYKEDQVVSGSNSKTKSQAHKQVVYLTLGS